MERNKEKLMKNIILIFLVIFFSLLLSIHYNLFWLFLFSSMSIIILLICSIKWRKRREVKWQLAEKYWKLRKNILIIGTLFLFFLILLLIILSGSSWFEFLYGIFFIILLFVSVLFLFFYLISHTIKKEEKMEFKILRIKNLNKELLKNFEKSLEKHDLRFEVEKDKTDWFVLDYPYTILTFNVKNPKFKIVVKSHTKNIYRSEIKILIGIKTSQNENILEQIKKEIDLEFEEQNLGADSHAKNKYT